MNSTIRTATVSAQTPDWSREAISDARRWDPSRRLIQSIRRYQRYRGRTGPTAALKKKLAVLEHRFWSAVTASDIPLNCHIDGGFKLPHPAGVVVHPSARIGPNCLLFQQVTLGTADSADAPVLGGHVEVGAGAKILGGVTIGDHVRIGANSVVIDDVPAGATVVGVPARIVRVQDDGASARQKSPLRDLTVVPRQAQM